MRHIICVEGSSEVQHQYIMPGALKWDPDEAIPVSFNFDHGAPPVGKASDIQRNENGVITAEIELFDRRTEAKEDKYGPYVEVSIEESDTPLPMTISIYMTHAQHHRWRDVTWVESAFIRAAALVPHSYWRML